MGADQAKPLPFAVLVVNADRQSNKGSASAIAKEFPHGGLAFLSEWGPRSLMNPGNMLVKASDEIVIEYISADVSAPTSDPTGVAWDAGVWEREKNDTTGPLRLVHKNARAILAILTHKETKQRVFALSVHMWLENKKDIRKATIEKLAELITALKEKDAAALILIGGDFNAPLKHVNEKIEPLGFEAGNNEEIENLFFPRGVAVCLKRPPFTVRYRREANERLRSFSHPFVEFEIRV